MGTTTNQTKNNLVPIAIIAGLFAVFGFVTWINGALIPYMGIINELTDAQAYLVASASYISFVVMALPASAIINTLFILFSPVVNGRLLNGSSQIIIESHTIHSKYRQTVD